MTLWYIELYMYIQLYIHMDNVYLLQYKVELCLSLVYFLSFKEAEVGPAKEMVRVIHDDLICCCVEKCGLTVCVCVCVCVCVRAYVCVCVCVYNDGSSCIAACESSYVYRVGMES